MFRLVSQRLIHQSNRLVGSQLRSMTGGAMIAQMQAENPHLDVVRYEHKNRTWTTQHVNYYSEALAIGLVETGLTKGDVVLAWLPGHFSEQMVLQFACSRAGLVLYNLDPSLAIQDPAKSSEALKAALELTKANVLISQEAADDVNYVRIVHDLIPELKAFRVTEGMPFVTPRFPDLRMCIHTGFDDDDKHGWFPLRHMIVPSNNLQTYVDESSITDKIPLAGSLKLTPEGVPTALDKPKTHSQIVKDNLWPVYCSILNKEFQDVEGIGVEF